MRWSSATRDRTRRRHSSRIQAEASIAGLGRHLPARALPVPARRRPRALADDGRRAGTRDVLVAEVGGRAVGVAAVQPGWLDGLLRRRRRTGGRASRRSSTTTRSRPLAIWAPSSATSGCSSTTTARAASTSGAAGARTGRRASSRSRPTRSTSATPSIHSYWSASSTLSRPARLAGMIAATTPATTATATNAASVATGRPNCDVVVGQRLRDERRQPDPERQAERRADQRRDDALVPHHPPRLAARQPDRPQHPELARPLEDRQHERVDHPEQADDHRERRAGRRAG